MLLFGISTLQPEPRQCECRTRQAGRALIVRVPLSVECLTPCAMRSKVPAVIGQAGQQDKSVRTALKYRTQFLDSSAGCTSRHFWEFTIAAVPPGPGSAASTCGWRQTHSSRLLQRRHRSACHGGPYWGLDTPLYEHPLDRR
jgi:hypothetical protein